MNIEKIIGNDENPLVSIVRIEEPGKFRRGMGFVYKKLSRKIKIIATCRHTFQHPFEEYIFLLGGKSTPLKVLSEPFFDENISHDMALIVVEDSHRKQTADFNLNPKTDVFEGKILYNSKCDYNPLAPREYPFYVMRQQIHVIDMCFAVKANQASCEKVKPDNLTRQSELENEGFVIYPSVCMKSVSGCSGSPIFDDNMNLFGINIRSTENNEAEGDEMVYVPTAEVNRLFKKIEPQIKKFGF